MPLVALSVDVCSECGGNTLYVDKDFKYSWCTADNALVRAFAEHSYLERNYIAGLNHYNEIIMGTIASQITSLTIVYSTVYSDTDQRKHQSSTPLVPGEFPAQMASYAENVSIWWRHQKLPKMWLPRRQPAGIIKLRIHISTPIEQPILTYE